MKHIVITRFPYESILSGEEWHTINLAEKLREDRYSVDFVGSCKVLCSEFKKRNFHISRDFCGHLPVSKLNLILFTLELPFLIPYIWIRFLLRHLTKKIDTLYMLSLSEKLILTPFALLFRINVLWVEHQRMGKWIFQNPYRHWYRFLSRFVKVVCVSDMYAKDLLQLGVQRESIHVIPNGIDTKMFHPEVKLFLVPEIFAIGCVARLYKDKGIDVLIKACSRLNTPYMLYILGEGPEKEHLHTIGDQKNITWFTPYNDISREDVPGFMKSMDVMVLPSTEFDPFGLVAAESMAVGTTTIVTDVCGISGYLTNKKDAIITKSNDENALLSGIKYAMGDKNIAKNGYKKALRLFSQERMVEEYKKII